MLNIIRKFGIILNKQQKIRVCIIMAMMVIGAFLETLGVGLILPLISVITDEDFIVTNPYANLICQWLHINSAKTFVMTMIIALICIYILKNIYLFVEYFVQWRFVCNNRFGTQQQLMQQYLSQSYEYFLNSESGEIIRVINDDVTRTFTLLSTILNFFTEAVISVALVITIIVTDPMMAVLTTVVLGGVLVLVNRILKPILRNAGIRYQNSVAESNKWMIQSISGIKEVKVSRSEKLFLKQFSIYGKKAIDAEKVNNVLNNVPRLSIEAFGISSMLAVIAILMCMGREINAMLPQLTAFAMAAVRLLPSVNRMSTALNTMAYYEPSLDKMIENLQGANLQRVIEKKSLFAEKQENDLNAHTANKIELCDITYYYPHGEYPVLEHANMVVISGQSVGIVGASGAGKTTAIDILLGLLQPQSGCVKVDGQDIRENYAGWLNQLSYIPQTIFMLDDTIRANVAFGVVAEEIDDNQVWKALEEAQLKEFVQSLPEGLDTSIGERGVRLSGGQRQRIGIARALYSDPQLLIFDEATSALDIETESAIMESINALHGKKTLIIIAHRLTTIKECDVIYKVENGKIVMES